MKAKFIKICQECTKGEMKYAEIFIHGEGYKHVCDNCQKSYYYAHIYPRLRDLDLDLESEKDKHSIAH